jgi:hypothetical protein
VITIFTLAFAAVPLGTLLQARDDSRIQHGLKTTAYVNRTRVETSSRTNGQTYDTYVNVWFRPAAEPRIVNTTVHVPGRHAYESGQIITVRYDPDRPTNAELAGHPAVGWTGFSVALAGFLLLVWLTVYVWRARGKAMRAANEAAPATAAAS